MDKKDDLLLNIMLELSYYKSKDGLCATVVYENRKESVLVTSQEYYDYIGAKYYDACGKFVRNDGIRDRLQIIRYMQKIECAEETVFESRYVNMGKKILINMANEKFQYISVSSKGYKIITPKDDTPLFVKDSLETPMDYPIKDDSIDSIDSINLIDDLVNLCEDDIFFLKIWLISAMNPEIRTPILYLLGDQGSGKSSVQILIYNLIYPTSRGLVNWDGLSIKDLTIALNRSYLINFDNVSKIDQERSDLLCQATTGGKKSFRKLYTDNDEVNYDLYARISIASTQNCIKQPDLAQRVYFVNMKDTKEINIPEDQYLEYCQERIPKILNGLLETLSRAMRFYGRWCKKYTATYRLASFELFGGLVACIFDGEEGYERFQKILRKNHIQQVFPNDEKRPYFESMIEVLEADDNPFEGKLKELYDYVNEWITEYSELPYTDDIILDYESFSKSIHQYKNGIVSFGYDIEFYKSRPDNYSSIRIEKRKNHESS